MITNNKCSKNEQIEMVAVSQLVPEDHIIRAIDSAIDFSFIYDEVEALYSHEIGRPSIDPVVLFKIVLIQYTFGIRSMRQTIKEIEVNMAYRWFLGLGFSDKVPHFSSFGKNYKRRFEGTDIFERVFERILKEAVDSGFVDASVIFIDATHIKASANKKKAVNEAIPIEARHYEQQLKDEINKDRAAHNKKPLKDHDDDDNEPPKTRNTKKSTVDPQCGLFHKGEHKVEFAYTAHTACDKHNFIIAAEVAAGNVHDSVMFDTVYEQATKRFPEAEVVAMDSGYKTPWIMKKIIDDGRLPSTPYKRPMTKKGFFKKYEYVYDEYYDCVICPANKVLKYSTTNKDGYREFKSDPQICKSCPMREQCTQSKNCQKTVTLHIWSDYMERAEDIRHSPIGKETYAMRSQTIERVFADAKEKHAMRYTQYRGKAKLKMQVLLTFACMNLKKLANWKLINNMLPSIILQLYGFIQKFIKIKMRYSLCTE